MVSMQRLARGSLRGRTSLVTVLIALMLSRMRQMSVAKKQTKRPSTAHTENLATSPAEEPARVLIGNLAQKPARVLIGGLAQNLVRSLPHPGPLRVFLRTRLMVPLPVI
jgi:hypothetical protein